jgi:hypothetical protein
MKFGQEEHGSKFSLKTLDAHAEFVVGEIFTSQYKPFTALPFVVVKRLHSEVSDDPHAPAITEISKSISASVNTLCVVAIVAVISRSWLKAVAPWNMLVVVADTLTDQSETS